MSDNLEYFFDELRTVGHTPMLASSADIRRVAARRTAVRRAAVVAVVVLAVLAGGLTAYSSGLLGSAPTRPPVGGLPSATATAAPTPSAPAPTGTSSPPSSTSPPPRPPGADCRPDDLDPLPYYGTGGAMGTVYHTVLVQNRSASTCRLYGHPSLAFTEPATGQRGVLVAKRRDEARPVQLAPGGWAAMSLSTANGNPYPPGAPECATPRSYRGISVLVGDERYFGLPGFALSWECGDATEGPWTASAGPGDPATAEQVVRATPEPGVTAG